jgi:hypothetical protein
MSPSGFLRKKNILCSKPDDITGLDGTFKISVTSNCNGTVTSKNG